MMIMPGMTSWDWVGSPSPRRPLDRNCRISTPSAMPPRLPMPPARLTPPSTVAATTWNSKLSPPASSPQPPPPHIVTGKARNFRIAANGIDLPPERTMAHHVGEERKQNDGDHGRIGNDAEQPSIGQRDEAVQRGIVGDGALAGVEVDAPAHDEHHAQRDNQRVDAGIGGEPAVDDPDRQPEHQGGRDTQG